MPERHADDRCRWRPRPSTARRRRPRVAGGVKPSVFRSARSRRRRRTDAMQRQREGGHGAGGEGGAEEGRGGAHRAVVDDLGRALHRAARSTPCRSARSARWRSGAARGARPSSVRPAAQTDEDGVRAGERSPPIVPGCRSRDAAGRRSAPQFPSTRCRLIRGRRPRAWWPCPRSAVASVCARPVLASTVSPTCLWSCGRVVAPSTTWSGASRRVAGQDRRPDRGVGASADDGHGLAVELACDRSRRRSTRRRRGRGRGAAAAVRCGNGAAATAAAQLVVPVPPVQRGLGHEGVEAGCRT